MIGSSTSPPFGVVLGAHREREGTREDAADIDAIAATDAPSPFVFEAAGSTCFAWFHAPRIPARGVGVVLCRPIGYEAMCTSQTYALLALRMASEGFAVLRFDYPGTGDSSGNDAQPDRVKAWQEGIIRAVAEVRRLGRVSSVALVGVRLGATLAAKAACELGGVDSLVMWAPCTTGRSFARELRTANASRGVMPDEGVAEGDMEALGYLYTAQTLADFDRLDATDLPTAPAHHALIIGRDDMPAEGPLPARYRELGVAAEYCEWPGYAAMMNEPHKAVLDPHIVGHITNWLCRAHPARGTQGSSGPALPTAIEFLDGDVRESPIGFGPGQSLFGILSEPLRVAGDDAGADFAVVMINVGANTHIGPNRLYTRVARELASNGYRCFRMDLTGMGDSRPDLGFSNDRLFSDASTADARAAIDMLSARGVRRFYLLGICSGSFVAFQTALADPRVIGQVLMNARLLEKRKGERAATWDNLMQEHYKSTH
ncbi:MAG TPA: alpha/beta fold hydrolase, partial [Ramlibacter sp.]|nr:alpha/beta fold hydrolase [Ramlibacter sp.]